MLNNNNDDDDDDDNNNTKADVYGAVIMAQPLRVFTRFTWRMQNSANSSRRPLNQANRLEPEIRLYAAIVSTCTISQPESWYSFYHPTEGRKLSRPRWFVKYWDGLPVRRQSPIQAVTGPGVEQLRPLHHSAPILNAVTILTVFSLRSHYLHLLSNIRPAGMLIVERAQTYRQTGRTL